MAYPRSQRSRSHKFARLTSGDLSPSVATTNWTVIHATAFDLTLPAQVGDTLLCTFSFRMSGGNFTFIDAFTLVGGVPISGVSGLGYSAGANSGIGAMVMPNGGNGGYGITIPYTLVAGDISAGTVTVRPYHRQNTAGTTFNLFASASAVALFGIENIGPVSPH